MHSQAKEKQSTKARKRWEGQIPGWLVLYSLALCGINAAKQHFSCKNFSDIVHEIVPAQPQEIPVYYGRKSGRRRTEAPYYVRAPTSNAKNARASPWQPTWTFHEQGERSRQAQAPRRRTWPDGRPKKVRDFARNKRRISEFWGNVEELITPGNFPSDYFVTTPKINNNNRTPTLTPAAAASQVVDSGLWSDATKNEPNMLDSTVEEENISTNLADGNLGGTKQEPSSEEEHRDATDNSQTSSSNDAYAKPIPSGVDGRTVMG